MREGKRVWIKSFLEKGSGTTYFIKSIHNEKIFNVFTSLRTKGIKTKPTVKTIRK